MAEMVTAPERVKRTGGIKSVTGEFEINNRLAAGHDLVWEDGGCDRPSPERAGCYDDVVDQEDFDTEGLVQHTLIGDPFARYAGSGCLIDGDSVGDSYAKIAEDRLSDWEDREVEAVLWEWASSAPFSETAANVKDAIAAAEHYADKHYVGKPVIILSRSAASRAQDVLSRDKETGDITTSLDTPVIATGEVEDADIDTVTVIGRPKVFASDMLVNPAILQGYNKAMAIAQRVFGIAVDCDFRYAVNVTAP